MTETTPEIPQTRRKRTPEVPSGEIRLREPFRPFRNLDLQALLPTLRRDQPVEPTFTVAERAHWIITIRPSYAEMGRHRESDWSVAKFTQENYPRWGDSHIKRETPIITPDGIKEIPFHEEAERSTWSQYPLHFYQIEINSIDKEFQDHSPQVRLIIHTGRKRSEYKGVVWKNASVINDPDHGGKEKDISEKLAPNIMLTSITGRLFHPTSHYPNTMNTIRVWTCSFPMTRQS